MHRCLRQSARVVILVRPDPLRSDVVVGASLADCTKVRGGPKVTTVTHGLRNNLRAKDNRHSNTVNRRGLHMPRLYQALDSRGERDVPVIRRKTERLLLSDTAILENV